MNETGSSSTIRLSRLSAIAFALAIFFLLAHRFVYHILHPLWIVGDQAVYVMTAELILDGKVPYRDFFDFNPPLIMYLNVLPAMLSRLLHLPSPLVFSITVLTFQLLSFEWCTSIIIRRSSELKPLIFLPVIWSVASLSTHLLGQIGEREHIFLITFLPFLFLRGLRHSAKPLSKFESILAGVFAGIGLCLKPQFILIAIAAEVGWIIEQRKLTKSLFLTPEIISIVCVATIYLVSFLLLPAEALKIYFDQSIPIYMLGSRLTTSSFGDMIYRFSATFETLLMALLLTFVLRRWNKWFVPTTLICLSSLIVYISGDQAWFYRQMPLEWFSNLLLMLGITTSIDLGWRRLKQIKSSLRTSSRTIDLMCIVVCLVSICTCVYIVSLYLLEFNNTSRTTIYDGDATVECVKADLYDMYFTTIKNSEPSDSIVWLGSGLYPGSPVMLQSKRKSGSRYLYSILENIEWAEQASPERSESLKKLEAEVIQNLANDIEKNKPALIYVSEFQKKILQKWRFIDLYLAPYENIGEVDGCTIYKLTKN